MGRSCGGLPAKKNDTQNIYKDKLKYFLCRY